MDSYVDVRSIWLLWHFCFYFNLIYNVDKYFRINFNFPVFADNSRFRFDEEEEGVTLVAISVSKRESMAFYTAKIFRCTWFERDHQPFPFSPTYRWHSLHHRQNLRAVSPLVPVHIGPIPMWLRFKMKRQKQNLGYKCMLDFFYTFMLNVRIKKPHKTDEWLDRIVDRHIQFCMAP